MPPLTTDEGKPHPAWAVDAEPEDYKNAATFLISAVEPGASEERTAFLARLLSTREYSKAELALVMKELPFDPEASHNYNQGLNPADVERIISEHRTLRARLTQRITSEQRDDLIAEAPGEIDPDDFECAGFDEHDNPLWLYAPTADQESAPEPRPQLEETRPNRDPEEAEGLTTFEEMVSGAQERAEPPAREAEDHVEGAAYQQADESGDAPQEQSQIAAD